MIKHNMTIINLWGRGERDQNLHILFLLVVDFLLLAHHWKQKRNSTTRFSCISIKIATLNIPSHNFCKWSLKRIPLLSKAPNLDTHFSSMNFSIMPNTSPRILEHSTFIVMLTSKSLPYINLKKKTWFQLEANKEKKWQDPINKRKTRNDRNLTPIFP